MSPTNGNPQAPNENDPVGVLAGDDEALHEQLHVNGMYENLSCKDLSWNTLRT